MAVEYVIDVEHLGKTFAEERVVKDVSLKIKAGEIFGFLGPNGSGKTTTMRMLCGLVKPTYGRGQCLGYDVLKETDEIKKQVGYMQQYFGLYKYLTVYENLELIAGLHGLTNIEESIRKIMDELNLDPYENHLAGTLSGGWKQKLSLGAALIHNPMLLLLDEPTASIDVQSRRFFWELMQDLSERGITIIFTSHNMEEIVHSHRISYLYNGNILMTGRIKDILESVKLTAWQVRGKNIWLLAKQLRALPSVEQVITFPHYMRVLGQDAAQLELELQPYLQNPRYKWRLIAPRIEDLFVFFSRKYENK